MASKLTPFEDYFLALGELHHCYTDLEHELTCIIRNAVTSGLTQYKQIAVVSAVLGGMRMQPAKDTIKRLMRVIGKTAEERTAVDKTFAHLGDIQFLRDRLAHHFTSHNDNNPGTWVNDDFAGIREISKWTTIELTPAILRSASADLRAMKYYLDGLFTGYVQPPLPQLSTKPFDPDAMPTWQYKPVVPAPQHLSKGDYGDSLLNAPNPSLALGPTP